MATAGRAEKGPNRSGAAAGQPAVEGQRLGAAARRWAGGGPRRAAAGHPLPHAAPEIFWIRRRRAEMAEAILELWFSDGSEGDPMLNCFDTSSVTWAWAIESSASFRLTSMLIFDERFRAFR